MTVDIVAENDPFDKTLVFESEGGATMTFVQIAMASQKDLGVTIEEPEEGDGWIVNGE